MKKLLLYGALPAIALAAFLLILAKLDVGPVNSLIPNREVKLTILATADLHGSIPDDLAHYIQATRSQEDNFMLVDAGDFFDDQNDAATAMQQWFKICRNADNAGQPRRMSPIVRRMSELDYDAVVLGNHEFLSNDKLGLNELILDFTDCYIPVLSANLYETSAVNPYSGEYYRNYVTPYIMKDFSTPQGVLKVGILGLTLPEVGEGGENVEDLPAYKGSLKLEDMVKEADKWAECMKMNGADIVVAVVHSGEEPLKPRRPGNRVKELARSVNGIDAIVAAHTHLNISSHQYKNPAGQSVIVTQPGKWGEYCSRIDFVLTKEKGKWLVKDKSSRTKEI